MPKLKQMHAVFTSVYYRTHHKERKTNTQEGCAVTLVDNDIFMTT